MLLNFILIYAIEKELKELKDVFNIISKKERKN